MDFITKYKKSAWQKLEDQGDGGVGDLTAWLSSKTVLGVNSHDNLV